MAGGHVARPTTRGNRQIMNEKSQRSTARPMTTAVAWGLGLTLLAGPAAVRAQQPARPGAGREANKPNVTTDTGKPVGSDEHSATAGPDGPALLQHFYFLEKIARFDRERIPERVVHARGVGVHGEFVCTEDVTGLTRAAFLTKGKTTPTFTRFSVVVLPRGSAETARDVRGFAVKFYTDEGNYDLVGNDIPVFFIRDAMKFPDLIHSLKPSPVTNIQDPERFFDFFAAMPETTHMMTWLFSDQGTPASYRQVDGFGVNAFKWVNAKGAVHYIKYRWKSKQGVRNLSDDEAKIAAGIEPATLTKDMYDALKAGDFPSWELQVQVLTPEDLRKFDFDPLDATKLWPESMVKFQPVGTMTLKKFPDNFFELTEQVAFNTGAYVPGIEPSEDKLLQGRNFSYSDTQRHRLGVNYQQLPVNRPRSPVANDNQEGLDDHMLKKGDVNYNPSTREPGRLAAAPGYLNVGAPLPADNLGPPRSKDPKDFQQAGERYRSLSKLDQDHLIQNLAGELKRVRTRTIVLKMLSHFYKADEDFGKKLADKLNVEVGEVKGLATATETAK